MVASKKILALVTALRLIVTSVLAQDEYHSDEDHKNAVLTPFHHNVRAVSASHIIVCGTRLARFSECQTSRWHQP